ncbi:MAG TPA: penicillin-binding protein 1C [Bacteroidetes bacterium]|nr:penicillin-binding protein 1C [Bacteroidota bacterium]
MLVAGIWVLWFWFCLPNPLFDKPACTIIEASNGQLLGAKIAADGQWRFPRLDSIPEKFERAIITFEDKRFYSHPGIDLLAIGRAITQNIKNGRIVSGGSTLSMQVARLARRGRPRNFFQKTIEAIMTLRMEMRYSKKEILAFYASNAPFGGNVVGLGAASWRYFGKKPELLSWSEAATLAVLPNSPSLIHPGRNREALRRKRNRLLKKMLSTGVLDSNTYHLAISEPLPDRPHPLPRLAPHLLEKMAAGGYRGKLVRTTIDADLQSFANEVADRHNQLLKNNQIHNLAILILDVPAQTVLAYTGNARHTGRQHGQSVNIIEAPRSSGSILKPLLFASMLQEGELLPATLVPDIPTYLQNFRPENFSKTFDGVVPAREALSRSLNIPFVRLLQQYSVEKFHFQLKKLGLTTLEKEPGHYGLSLILGGAETTLWDLTNIYAGMARRLGHFYQNSGQYDETDFQPAVFTRDDSRNHRGKLVNSTSYLTADAIWLTFDAMKQLERPNELGDWQRFSSAQNIAWKTGTSHGFRDAWAVGISSRYAVGVWVGNADGEGRPGLTGIKVAAPILFEIFDHLPPCPWFDCPYDAMKRIATCRQSGYLAKKGCPVDSIWAAAAALNTPPCPYHELIHLDDTGHWQVNKSCPNIAGHIEYWFVLPPVEEYYYKPRHPEFRPLPPFHPDCQGTVVTDANPIELIYPPFKAMILVPVELDGFSGKAIFKAVHKNPGAVLYWHLDKKYIGTTSESHAMALNPGPGKHTLTLVDEQGHRLRQAFEIISKENRDN